MTEPTTPTKPIRIGVLGCWGAGTENKQTKKGEIVAPRSVSNALKAVDNLKAVVLAGDNYYKKHAYSKTQEVIKREVIKSELLPRTIPIYGAAYGNHEYDENICPPHIDNITAKVYKYEYETDKFVGIFCLDTNLYTDICKKAGLVTKKINKKTDDTEVEKIRGNCINRMTLECPKDDISNKYNCTVKSSLLEFETKKKIQQDLLVEFLTDTSTTHKIVVGHHPIVYRGHHPNMDKDTTSENIRNYLLPLLMEHKVNSYICAHEHNIQHHTITKDGHTLQHYIVGGGGTVLDKSLTDSCGGNFTTIIGYVVNELEVKKSFGFMVIEIDSRGKVKYELQFVKIDTNETPVKLQLSNADIDECVVAPAKGGKRKSRKSRKSKKSRITKRSSRKSRKSRKSRVIKRSSRKSKKSKKLVKQDILKNQKK